MFHTKIFKYYVASVMINRYVSFREINYNIGKDIIQENTVLIFELYIVIDLFP